MNKNIGKNIIIIGVITSFITAFMGSGLNLSIPALEEEFDVSTGKIGWVVTIYMITCAALAVPFGRIADRLQRRKILLVGIAIFASASGLAVISREMWVLLVFRLVQAVGASMIFSTNVAMMAASCDETRRGKIVGYAASANYAGLAAGPVLGGILNHHFGWRTIFIATAAVSGAALMLGILKLGRNADVSSLQQETKKRKVTGIKELVSNRAYICANLAASINYGSNYTISYIISIYLQAVRGMTSQNAGFVLITSTAVMAAMAPFFGKLSDKIKPQILSAAGMAICAGALSMFVFMSEETGLIKLIIILAVSGLGFAMFSSPNTNAVMSCVKKEDYGFASSVLSTMRSVGNTVSMTIITTVVGIYMGSGNLKNARPEVIMKAMDAVFIVFTILCILGIFMAMRRKV